jgi:hypothetical protein
MRMISLDQWGVKERGQTTSGLICCSYSDHSPAHSGTSRYIVLLRPSELEGCMGSCQVLCGLWLLNKEGQCWILRRAGPQLEPL